MKAEYKIGGLKCGACVTTVEKALTSLTGVSSAKVTGDRVTLETDRELSAGQLDVELKKIGQYTVEPIKDDVVPTSSCCCN